MIRLFPFILGLSLSVVSSCSSKLDEVSIKSAFTPVFTSTEGEHSAGTAFVVEYKSNFYAVTAHHLFSEAGGFSREYSWRELQDLVSGVHLHSLSDDQTTYTTRGAIEIAGAASVSELTGKDDIAIFKLNEQPAHFLQLAQTEPEVGDTVWLYGSVYNQATESLLHKAKVTEYNANWISYQFEDPRLILSGTSGAAILNSKGEVVGINLSGEEWHGKLYGYGNPLVSIQSIFKIYL